MSIEIINRTLKEILSDYTEYQIESMPFETKKKIFIDSLYDNKDDIARTIYEVTEEENLDFSSIFKELNIDSSSSKEILIEVLKENMFSMENLTNWFDHLVNSAEKSEDENIINQLINFTFLKTGLIHDNEDEKLDYENIYIKLKKRRISGQIKLNILYPYELAGLIQDVYLKNLSHYDIFEAFYYAPESEQAEFKRFHPNIYQVFKNNIDNIDNLKKIKLSDFNDIVFRFYLRNKFNFRLNSNSKSGYIFAYLLLKNDEQSKSFLKNIDDPGIIDYFNNLEKSDIVASWRIRTYEFHKKHTLEELNNEYIRVDNKITELQETINKIKKAKSLILKTQYGEDTPEEVKKIYKEIYKLD